jgi:hypothetical protein
LLLLTAPASQAARAYNYTVTLCTTMLDFKVYLIWIWIFFG